MGGVGRRSFYSIRASFSLLFPSQVCLSNRTGTDVFQFTETSLGESQGSQPTQTHLSITRGQRRSDIYWSTMKISP